MPIQHECHPRTFPVMRSWQWFRQKLSVVGATLVVSLVLAASPAKAEEPSCAGVTIPQGGFLAVDFTLDNCFDYGSNPAFGGHDGDEDFLIISPQNAAGDTSFEAIDGAFDPSPLIMSVNGIPAPSGSNNCSAGCLIEGSHGGVPYSFVFINSAGVGSVQNDPPADVTAPTVTSILRLSPGTESTGSDTLVFEVTFSENVENVDVADFTPTGTTASIESVFLGSASVYSVTVSGGNLGSLNGTVGLSFSASQNITDAASNALSNTTPSGSNQTFTLVNLPEINILGNGVSIVSGDVTPSAADHTDFGTLNVTSGSTPNTFTIQNTGTGDLSISSVSSSDNAQFQVSGTTGGTLSPSSSGTFTVTFDPSSARNKTATITVVSNDADESPYTFTVQGVGLAPPTFTQAFAPSTIARNAISTLTFTIGNTDNATDATRLNFTDNLPVAVTVASAPNASTTCTGGTVTANALATTISYTGGTVAARSTCTISVDVVASAMGTFTNITGDLTSSLGNSGVSDATLAVSLEPEIAVAASIGGAVMDGGVNAQSTQPAGTPVTVTYTVTNTGTADLTLATATASAPTNVTVNSIGAPGSTTVVAGGTTTFDVQYTPTLAGAFSFELSFVNDDSDENPFDFTVSGTASGGPEINISASIGGVLIDGGTNALGNQPVGAPVTITYTITNTGTADLTVSSATLSSFVNVTSIIQAASGLPVIAPGGTATLNQVLTPSAVGAFSIVLGIDNDDSDENPFNLTVSGTATTAPDIAVSSSESGSVADGGTDTISSTVTVGESAAVTYTIENTGTSTLNIIPPTVGGNISGDSNVTVNSLSLGATSVEPGGTTTLVVDYTPSASGPFGFDLVIESDVAGPLASYEIAVGGIAAVRPTVTLSGIPEGYSGTEIITVTATFSESVTGFTTSGVNLVNGSVSSVSGSGAVYIIVIAPNGSDDVSISIPGDVAFAMSGAGNLPSAPATILNRSSTETEATIAKFMANRSTQLINNQPNLRALTFGRAGNGGATLSAKNGAIDFHLDAFGSDTLWFNLTGSRATGDGDEGTYLFGAIGSHYWIDDNHAVGAMLQFDYLDYEEGESTISGRGWLIGPYISARSASQLLYYSGYVLYGKTDNTISPFGTYEDGFETDRILANAEVSGEIEKGRTTLFPTLSATWTRDKQRAYVDGLGNTINGQSLEMGKIAIGLDFETLLAGEYVGWTFFGGLQGSYNFVEGPNSGAVDEYEGGRGRVKLGVSRDGKSGSRLEVSGYYDGLGAKNYESYGLSLSYGVSF